MGIHLSATPAQAAFRRCLPLGTTGRDSSVPLPVPPSLTPHVPRARGAFRHILLGHRDVHHKGPVGREP